jgi:hypothetical protein
MGNWFSEEESVSFLVILNREIELITHVVDIALNGFSRDLEFSGEERTVWPALGFDCFVDEFHPGDRHSDRWKSGNLTPRHDRKF